MGLRRQANSHVAAKGALHMLCPKSKKSCILPVSFTIRLVSWPDS